MGMSKFWIDDTRVHSSSLMSRIAKNCQGRAPDQFRVSARSEDIAPAALTLTIFPYCCFFPTPLAPLRMLMVPISLLGALFVVFIALTIAHGLRVERLPARLPVRPAMPVHWRLTASLAHETGTEPSPLNGGTKDDDDERFQPYQGEQPSDALLDIFIPRALPCDESDDELLWVPQTDFVSFRPLCLCVSGGYYVNLLRVRGAGVLSRHRHPGPVHGHVLRGRWHYLEHDWVAEQGSYVFEPPGEIHTLVVPEGVDEMITLFHVTGSLLYCDVDGKVVGADDVFTKLELAKKHYTSVGLGEDFVQQFVR